ncbi:MAG TPA: hypothetical protein VKG87_10965, partial [Terriglobales bacterium]|nr:hypothetical protein [Terriglobales bacterium]
LSCCLQSLCIGDAANAFIPTRRHTASPAMNARSPVAAHAMQSYYIFDIEGMQQRPGHVLYSGPSSFTYGTVNAGICEPFIPCIEPGRYRLDCASPFPDSESQS